MLQQTFNTATNLFQNLQMQVEKTGTSNPAQAEHISHLHQLQVLSKQEHAPRNGPITDSDL